MLPKPLAVSRVSHPRGRLPDSGTPRRQIERSLNVLSAPLVVPERGA